MHTKTLKVHYDLDFYPMKSFVEPLTMFPPKQKVQAGDQILTIPRGRKKDHLCFFQRKQQVVYDYNTKQSTSSAEEGCSCHSSVYYNQATISPKRWSIYPCLPFAHALLLTSTTSPHDATLIGWLMYQVLWLLSHYISYIFWCCLGGKARRVKLDFFL